MTAKSLILLSAAIMILGGGCAAPVIRPQPMEPLEKPAAVLDEFLRRRLGVDSSPVGGIAQIAIDHPHGKVSSRAAFIVRAPSDLRVESLPLFGPPDIYLTASEDRVTLFLPREGRFLEGRPQRETLARFFSIPLLPREIVSLIRGLPPELPAREDSIEGFREGQDFHLTMLSGTTTKQSLTIDGKRFLLKTVEIFNPEGKRLYKASLDDYSEGKEFPRNLSILFDSEQPLSIVLRFSDLNTVIPAMAGSSAFKLDPPPGIITEYIE